MDSASQYNFNKFVFHNLADNSEKEIRYIRDNFQFSKQNLIDVANPPLRPKIEFYNDYIFIILLFPIYNRKAQIITPVEIDIFLNKKNLVLIHNNSINSIADFTQKLETIPDYKNRYQKKGPLETCLDILEETILSLYPMLNHLSWDIDNIDSQLFTNRERELIIKVLAIKKNIVDVRKSLQSHLDVMNELRDNYKSYFSGANPARQLNSIIKHTSDIWDQLENHKQTIDAIAQSNESLINIRLNQIMKNLTVFAVIVFPLTLLAAIFGMNTLRGMPFVNSSGGFWKVMAIMLIGTVLMFYYFKKKRWI